MHDGAKRRSGQNVLFVLALTLSCILAGASYAGSPDAVVRVTVTPAAEGVRLRYDLPRLRAKFQFDPHEPRSAAALMQLETSGLTLKDGVVSGASPFKSFSVMVRPDTRRLDATYPVLARVGANGLLLFTPPLSQDPSLGGTRFRFDLPPNATAIDGAGANGFVFLGPSSYAVDYGSLTLVAPPDTPVRLRARIRDQTVALLSFYARELGRPAPRPPVLVIAYDAGSTNPGFVGDVTPNGMVLLQLTAATTEADVGGGSFLSRFVAHEVFHLWNGGSYHDRKGLNGNWLREGSAEYASWLAAEALWPEGQSLEERITQQLPPCMATLRSDALIELSDQRAQTSRYSCGSVAHWLADVAVRGAGGGGVLKVWARLLADERGYDVEDFMTAMKPYNGRAGLLDSILRGSGRNRWPGVFAALRKSGVYVDIVPPSNDALRSTTVHAILRQVCKGEGLGFETMGLTEPPTAVVLRADPMSEGHQLKCGVLAGDPHLLTVNSRSALGDWAPIFQDVTAACANRGEIVLALRRGSVEETVPIRCDGASLKPRTEYRVRNALPPVPGAPSQERSVSNR